MKLETLKEFVVLAKHGSFSKAAPELYESQPTLSSHISALEQELGFQLIHRATTISTLTTAGEAFLDTAQEVLRIAEDGVERCQQIAKQDSPLRITALDKHSPFFSLLRNSDLSIEFIDLDINQSSFEALAKNELDVAFSIPPTQEEMDDGLIIWEHLRDEPAVICMMNTHPLAENERLTREDIKGKTVVCFSGALFDGWTQTVSRILGDDIGIDYKMQPLKSVANLALTDLGNNLYICGKDSVSENFVERDDIRIFEALDSKPLHFPSGIGYRKDCKNGQLFQLLELFDAYMDSRSNGSAQE